MAAARPAETTPPVGADERKPNETQLQPLVLPQLRHL